MTGRVNHRADRRRAFSLLEALVSIALVLALTGSLYGFLRDMLTTRSRAIEEAGRQRAAMTLLDHLEADLQTCLVGSADVGAGIKGTASQVRILTRGVATEVAARHPTDERAVFSDLQWAEYRWSPVRADAGGASAEGLGLLEARRGVAGAGLSSGDEPFVPLGGPVARLRLRYHDGQRWRSSYDSLVSNALPRAVEVSIWFNPPDDEPPQSADEFTPPTSAPASAGDRDESSIAEDVMASGERTQRPPDRVRIIGIPDPASLQSSSTLEAEERGPEGSP